MRRSRLPLDQKAALMQSRTALEEKHRDRAAAAGKTAGMPRFLNQAGTAAALEAASGAALGTEPEAAAASTDNDLASLLPDDDTGVEEPLQRMEEDGADLVQDLSPAPLPDVSVGSPGTELEFAL